jgi:SulP family sulfate permease
MELVAQGAANVGAAVFGGFCVTGTIARTATNVRAGAHGPVAGMAHSAFLFLFLLVAAPLAGHIPLAALAGVLATVAWGMAERHAFAGLLTGSRGDAVALLATFLLTLFRDLTEAIVVGFAIGSVVFIHRMSEITAVTTHAPFVPAEGADEPGRGPAFAEALAADPEVAVQRITGVLFFGAASILDATLDRIGDAHRALVIDLAAVPFLDSSGAHSLERLARKAERRGVRLFIAGADAQARRALLAQGLRPPLAGYAATVDDALAQWREARAAG